MGHSGTAGTKGQPTIDTTPATVSDMQAIADYAALVGNRKAGTTTQRNAATGTSAAWEDLQWQDATDGNTYLYKSGAWVKQRRFYQWANAAARAAATGMTEGDLGDQADTDVQYRYSGSAWANTLAGLVQIVPGTISGTGATVSAGGTITLASATTVSANNCFTSAYENYRIILSLASTSAAVNPTFRVRAAGADLSTGVYLDTAVQIGSTTPTWLYNAAATSIALGRSNGTFGGHIVADILSPALAQGTRIMQTGADAVFGRQGWGGVGNASVYDGLTIDAGSTTMIGTLRIYGMSNA